MDTNTAIITRNSATLADTENPALVYLLSLSTGSRRAMTESLATMGAYLTNTICDCPIRQYGDEARRMHGQDCKAATIRNTPWHRMTATQIADVRQWLAGQYSPATANKALAALRRVLRAAWMRGLISQDEYARLTEGIETVKGSREMKGRFIPESERVNLFSSCIADMAAADRWLAMTPEQRRKAKGAYASRAVAIRDRALLAVLGGCGLRRSEVSGLTRANYDAAAATLQVIGKGNKQRTVPMPDGTRRALDQWLALRGGDGPTDRVFCRIAKSEHISGESLTPDGIWHILQHRAKRAGLTGILAPHDFRRTVISSLLECADLATVADIAGHAKADTTRKYDRRGMETRRRAMAMMPVPVDGATLGE